MARKKFQNEDRVVGLEEAPASFRGRKGVIADYKGRGGYGVRFDDSPDITEYVNSNWIAREADESTPTKNPHRENVGEVV